MKMYEIENDKYDDLREYTENGLKILGKVMQCLEEIKSGAGYGERGGYGMREYDNDYEPEMGMREGYGMRRGVRGTGRYGR